MYRPPDSASSAAMNISKKIHPNGKSLLRLLKNTPENQTLHIEAGQRRPAASYAISLSQTLRRMEDVIEQLSAYVFSVQLNTEHEADQELAETTATLIKYVDRHINDCVSVVSAYFGADSSETRNFLKGIQSFADLRSTQAERLREHGARVRLISFKASTVVVSGFFIEAPDQQQTLGPCPLVHQGGNTAFSYNFYLRRVFLEIILLNTRLYDLLKRTGGLKESGTNGPTENMELVHLATRISALSLYIFPDELKYPLPNIFMTHDDGIDAAIITVPSLKKPQLPPLPCTISLSCDADEADNSYRVPYTNNAKS